VSREFSRNTGQRGYHFQQAQRTAQSRQAQVRHKPRKLRAERWSPEQFSFWLWAAYGVFLSYE